MTHNELAADLASHLRGMSKRITWEDLQLGESGSVRPDVYTLEPTYTRLAFEAFEVKVSVADFRRDVTSGKWQAYLRYANSVTFAVPAGLVQKTDVPSTCGLIVRSDSGGWRYAKKPVRQVIQELPWKAWVKLLLDGVHRSGHERREQMFSAGVARQKISKKFGDEVAGMVADLQQLPDLLRYARDQHEAEMERHRIHRQADMDRWHAERDRSAVRCSDSLAKLALALGLPNDALVTELQGRADQLLRILNVGENRWTRHPFVEMADSMEKLAKDLRMAEAALSHKPASAERIDA